MKTFKEFLNQVPHQAQKKKLWSAKKDQIFDIWKTLHPEQPIVMTPMSKGMGTGKRSYGEDGIRITGTWDYILSIIARLKDLMSYENNQQRLRLIFKGIDPSKNPHPNVPVYVFYINLENRGQGKPGRKDR